MKSNHEHGGDGVSRRKVLECMTWAETGVLWTISGGIPHSLGIVSEAMAQADNVQGFNIRRWSEQGLTLWAVSDLNADELQEFEEKFQNARHNNGT